MRRNCALGLLVLAGMMWMATPARPQAGKGDAKGNAKADEHAAALKAARAKGLDWLTKNQANNGAWGKTYSLAVTSLDRKSVV